MEMPQQIVTTPPEGTPMQSQSALVPVPDALSTDILGTLGLTADDLPEISTIAQKIDAANPLSVSQFGRDVGNHNARLHDELLNQVRSSDLDAAGKLLNEVVITAKQLNLNALSDKRSKVPFIGRYIDKLRMSKEQFMQHFNTAKEQIDSLIDEVEQSQQGLSNRIAALDDMFVTVCEEHRLLGMHIAAGKWRLHELRTQVDEMRKTPAQGVSAQEIADLDAFCGSLDKRLGDLTAQQHASLQSKPMIRMIQANNTVLVDKFHTIKELTIPSWKRQFLLALSLNEQKNAVQLADTIDNATQQYLIRNANLLRDNSVATAKANQRLVIDVSTLKTVQTTLISTVEDVIRITQDGIKARKDAEREITGMRGELENRLSRRLEAPRAH